MERIWRRAARVLPVDPDGKVLLLHGWDPHRPEQPFWFTIGGGAEPDEPLAAAAARELKEEVGAVVEPSTLGDPVGELRHRFSWAGRTLWQHEVYFAWAASPFAVDFAGMDAAEKDSIDQAAWWDPDELEADGAWTTPGLPQTMRRAVDAVAARGVRGGPDGAEVT